MRAPITCLVRKAMQTTQETTVTKQPGEGTREDLKGLKPNSKQPKWVRLVGQTDFMQAACGEIYRGNELIEVRFPGDNFPTAAEIDNYYIGCCK
jgi:hypothetical protein